VPIVADCPLQIVSKGEAVTVGIGFTVTVDVAVVAAHPPTLTDTVYVDVTVGLTVKVCPVPITLVPLLQL
jgi:hypothetical protein